MKQWHWIVLVGLTLLSVVGQFIEHHYWWEAIPGFFAVFGFVGSLVLIFVAKFCANLFIAQKPYYYDALQQDKDTDQEVNTNAH